MNEKNNYLYERQYQTDYSNVYNSQIRDYWMKMLGSDICNMVLENYSEVNRYFSSCSFTSKEIKKVNYLLEYVSKENNKSEFNYNKAKYKIYFTEFYPVFIEYGIEELQCKVGQNDVSWIDDLYMDFSTQLAVRLQKICLRTLIIKMHEYKENGLLIGENPKDQYRYFCNNVIMRKSFILDVFEQYPVLCRCVSEAIEKMASYYAQIIHHFQADKEAIQQCFSLERPCNKIYKIEGDFSDVHNDGRQVVKVQMEHGIELLYKPRSMENEKAFGKLLSWFSVKTGIDQYEYPILSYEDHSWCSIVEYKFCENQKELKNYYTRLGVQMFLAYFFSAKDLHFENMIACGEYPVFIDLETLSNIRYNKARNTANEEIQHFLAQSVLFTGALPAYHRNNINSSAISGKGGQKFSFKVPTIVDGGTSNMHIEYRNPVSGSNQNLAMIQGIYHDPLFYITELEEGFEAAYRAVLNHKEEFKKRIEALGKLKSRYLLADTQRYAMLLSTSYHPSMLADGAERELLLYSLWSGRKRQDKEIVDCEVRELLDGDIPYFYYRMDSKDLVNIKGKKIGNYFVDTAMEILFQRLDETDLEKQCELIDLSLKLMSDANNENMNHVYPVEKVDLWMTADSDGEEQTIQYFMQRLLKFAVWNKTQTEVNWYIPVLADEKSNIWDFRPMNMYLYNGLAGMLLLSFFLRKYDNSGEIEKIYFALKNMLFSYTDSGLTTLERLCSENTGAYEGESSIVYTYLLLYQIGKEEEYLTYARRHAEIVELLLEKDNSYDLIKGNAGAAHIFLKLYAQTSNMRYLKQAERCVDLLEKSAEPQSCGIGWRIDKQTPPLAGMAHGNSGILMPVIHLWNATKATRYERLAEEIWKYENYLYDSNTGNWGDMRIESENMDSVGAMAWCHGAPGILLSRIACDEAVKGTAWEKRFVMDKSRAYQKLKNYWKRDSWCLCHGICGNFWIMEEASDLQTDQFAPYRKSILEQEVFLLPKERMNPGLLNGYGGILYFLLHKRDSDIPNILK